jgi:hypothetical protein
MSEKKVSRSTRIRVQRLKVAAKHLRRTTERGYCEALEALSKAEGSANYRSLLRAASEPEKKQEPLTKAADREDDFIATRGQDERRYPHPSKPIWTVSIGGSEWGLILAEDGPRLRRTTTDASSKGCMAIEESDLGLFQVMNRARPWNVAHPATFSSSRQMATQVAGQIGDGLVTRYGSYEEHWLIGWSDVQVAELAFQFGMPLERYCCRFRRNQQDISEATFLRSPAFRAARQYIRETGTVPSVDAWLSGNSWCWAFLVALSDEDFDRAGMAVVGDYYSSRLQRRIGFHGHSNVRDDLERVWHLVRAGSQTPDFGLERVLSRKTLALLGWSSGKRNA